MDFIFIYRYCNGSNLAAHEQFSNKSIPNPKTCVSVLQCLCTNSSFLSCSYSVERKEQHNVVMTKKINIIQQVQCSPWLNKRKILNHTDLLRWWIWWILCKENLYPSIRLKIYYQEILYWVYISVSGFMTKDPKKFHLIYQWAKIFHEMELIICKIIINGTMKIYMEQLKVISNTDFMLMFGVVILMSIILDHLFLMVTLHELFT